MIGINLSGAEFGGNKDRYGRDYIYPSSEDIAEFSRLGFDFVRLPFKWERMQKELNGPLDGAELARMKQFLADAAKQGVGVMIDLHNYGRYDGDPIGSGAVPTDAFADFWRQLASALKDEPALLAYDLMNEPHDMGGAHRWPEAAQKAVDAIRTVDMKREIHVEGDGWSTAASWKRINASLDIHDPAGKLVYDAHVYFDKDNSGSYARPYDQDGAHPDIGLERLRPFLEWLNETGSKGFIGEFAVPGDDPRWIAVLDRFLEGMEQNGLSGAYWGGGPRWGDYPLAPIRGDGTANPQLATLLDYLDGDRAAAAALGLDVILAGTGAGDKLIGGTGDDQLDGKGGRDRLVGGAGDDIYIVDQRGDAVVEAADRGFDVFKSFVSNRLPGNVEDFVLMGTGHLRAYGNALENAVIGNPGANLLDGGPGDDMLHGLGGSDLLIGGTGKDLFKFSALEDSQSSQPDHIADFEYRYDLIDLWTIDANSAASGDQAFTFIGSFPFDGRAGQLRFEMRDSPRDREDRTLVQGDINGDAIADLAFYLDGATQPLLASHFIL